MALSGVHSAELRLGAAAHNVANLTTDGVRPLDVVQEERPSGGSVARVGQAETPRSVDRIREAVDQLRASYQYTASLRVLTVEDELRGQITNLLA